MTPPDRRGSVRKKAEEVHARMTDEELQALSRLRELALQTGEIESTPGYRIALVDCRNFLGYVEMALHDGSLPEVVDLFVANTSAELNELVKAAPARQGFADQYRSLQGQCVAAYRRLLTP